MITREEEFTTVARSKPAAVDRYAAMHLCRYAPPP
jgi:hypothetical protein